MERRYKRLHRVYAAWEYEKEIEELNQQSEEGWQLVRGGAFFRKYKKDPSVQYRYQVDLMMDANERGRYLETFREQGWEYVNHTFNGWYYFRKVYDPSLPESAYEIYTDRSAMPDRDIRWLGMMKRITVILMILCAISLILFLRTPKLTLFMPLVIYSAELAVFLFGYWAMKRRNKEQQLSARPMRFGLIFIALMLGAAANLILSLWRSSFQTQTHSDSAAPISSDLQADRKWVDFRIQYSDNYFMDLDVETDAPLTVTIVNESGETAYEQRGNSIHIQDEKIRLKRGEYDVYLSDFAGGKMEVMLDIN